MGKTYDNQEKSVLENVPGIEDGHGKTLLYVGANRYRAHLFPMFKDFGYDIDILEIWPDNVKSIRSQGRWDFRKVIEGDVRDVEKLEDYDVICWWHGPEHIEKDKFVELTNVFNRKFNTIILGGPLDDTIGQGPEYGNIHESHLWKIQLDDLEGLGFNTFVVEREDVDHVTAWKMGKE